MNYQINDFHILILSFQDVFKEYIKILQSKMNSEQSKMDILQFKVNVSSIKNNELKTFYDKLVIFLEKLSFIKNNEILIQGFYDNKYNNLIKIKYFLIKLKNPKARSLHDKIFTKILKMEKHVPLGITRIFEEFLKGITYFSNETEYIKQIPIYHRAASCGDSSADFIKKYLQCYKTNIPNNIKQKKEHIYKCYLERLIYDRMFQHSFMNNLNVHSKHTTAIEQNKGHKFQLTERARNFNSCFTGIKINIKIEYKNNFPIILYIYFYDKNNNIFKTEMFKKILLYDFYGNGYYDENVFVTINDGDEIITDVQEFLIEPIEI